MGIKRSLAEMGEFLENEEMSFRQMKILVAFTLGSVVAFGFATYLIVFVVLGY